MTVYRIEFDLDNGWSCERREAFVVSGFPLSTLEDARTFLYQNLPLGYEETIKKVHSLKEVSLKDTSIICSRVIN